MLSKEFGKHGPFAVGFPETFSNEFAFEFINRITEEKLLGFPSVLVNHEAQTFIFRGFRAVVRGSGG